MTLIHRTLQSLGCLLAFLFCLAGSAQATVTLSVGDFFVPQGTASTSIPFYVTGGDLLDGMNLVVEISQGGIFPASGSPFFTSIDSSTGTIWAGNQDLQGVTFSTRTGNTTITNVPAAIGGPATWTPASGHPVKTKDGFLVLSGTVAANGLIGTVTVSTVGVSIGVYDLKITPTFVTTNGGGSAGTVFDGTSTILTSLTNGTITVVPEPSTLALAAFGLVGLAAWVWRRKR